MVASLQTCKQVELDLRFHLIPFEPQRFPSRQQEKQWGAGFWCSELANWPLQISKRPCLKLELAHTLLVADSKEPDRTMLRS